MTDKKTRIEKDSLGEVAVPADRYWSAGTERARENFRIGTERMDMELVRAIAVVKKGAAEANRDLGLLTKEKCELICRVADEIIEGTLDDHFPLSVWQSGSGTQTNMNVNEVISIRGSVIEGGELTDGKARLLHPPLLHPNDDVNMSQSTNGVFPAAMHIAAYKMITEDTIPMASLLSDELRKKEVEFRDIIKTGRTHLMDATPMTLGDEFSGYAANLEESTKALEEAARFLLVLPLGATAVGTGMNSPADFGEAATKNVAAITGTPFTEAPNKFAAISGHETLVRLSGTLKALAVTITKVAGDIRLLASGPRSGIGELRLPPNEPGSSTMPGKVNPTQSEAALMVCAQVVGLDSALTIGAMGGQLELNACKPLIIHSTLTSARLMADVCRSFADKCVAGIEADEAVIKKHLESSFMLVTALATRIGYDKAATVARKAYDEDKTLREAAVELKVVTAEEFDEWVDPAKMLGPDKE